MLDLATSSNRGTCSKRNRLRGDRLRLWKEQNNKCYWCKNPCIYNGNGGLPNEFTIDHIIPLSFGGTNHWRNIVGSCYSCNNKRDHRWRQLKFCLINSQEENQILTYSLGNILSKVLI